MALPVCLTRECLKSLRVKLNNNVFTGDFVNAWNTALKGDQTLDLLDKDFK